MRYVCNLSNDIKPMKKYLKMRKIGKMYFFNKDYSVTIADIILKFRVCIQNILMEGSVSHNFDILLSYVFRK